MKTYFLAWTASDKRGHCIWEFPDRADGTEVTAKEALENMIERADRVYPTLEKKLIEKFQCVASVHDHIAAAL